MRSVSECFQLQAEGLLVHRYKKTLCEGLRAMEKYGTIPPKFTKDWWDYIWTYYKWYFVSAFIALILIVTTAVQCANRIDYDLTVSYVGDKYFDETAQEQVEAAMAEQIDDADGNGQKDVFFQLLNVGGTEQTDAQYQMAMQIKVSTEYAAGETFLYLYSKTELDSLLQTGSADGLFVSTSEWMEEGGSDTEFAVDLEGNAFFEQYGIPTDGLYMAVRAIRADEAEEQVHVIRSANAVKLANYIINYQA